MTQKPKLGLAAYLHQLEHEPGLGAFTRDHDRDVELRDLTEIGALEDGRWQETIARARKYFAGHQGRLGIHGPFWGLAVDTPDLEIRTVVQHRFDTALTALLTLSEGGHMVLHSPFTTWHHFNRRTFHDDSKGILDRTLATLTPLVKRAETHGVTLVLENCEDMDPFERLHLAAAFNSPAVKVSLDTGHAHYAHGAHGAPPVDAHLRAVAPALAHLHLQDADGLADRHWALGRGTIHWHEVFAALAEAGQTPLLILEMAKPEDILVSARYLSEQGLAS
jgi:sugar phosphate isomerase/epimerase